MNTLRSIALLLLLAGFGCNTPNSAVQEGPLVEAVAVDQLKSADIRGEELHYIEQGSGEPLIFIHGTVGDYRAWISRMEPYANHYHVTAYSRRYAYPNEQVFDESADYSVRVHADDLYALIKELDLGKVNIVGHSYGAYTALAMALDHPEVVASLVLGEPPAASLLANSPEGMANFEEFDEKYLSSAGEAFRADQNEQGVEFFLKGVMLDAFSLDQVPPEVKQGWLDNLPEVWGVSTNEWILPLEMSKIKGLEVPVLLLSGNQSPAWFGEIIKQLHRSLPRSELVTIENSSHGLYFENPAAVDRAVMDFLGRN